MDIYLYGKARMYRMLKLSTMLYIRDRVALWDFAFISRIISRLLHDLLENLFVFVKA